ncbi:MAG: DGQHR domain-containing protein [Myxococcales bacterium]
MAHLFRGPAVRAEQPLGEFWIAAIPAKVLLDATAPDPLRLAVDPSARRNAKDWDYAGDMEGNQRPLDVDRLGVIAKYIDTVESTFPNSIIIAAPSMATDDGDQQPWGLKREPGSNAGILTIPENPMPASVVDGQHRLYAFTKVSEKNQRDFTLVCAVFLDLPRQVQAMVFATINSNQKAVKRGLAMNMYGYNVRDEDRAEWAPEKLAVFLSRRLNFDPASPLQHRVRVEALDAPAPTLLPGAKRAIAMAAIVDGIVGLISKSAKADRTALRTKVTLLARRRRKELEQDGAVLRDWYVGGEDALLYDFLKEVFKILLVEVWEPESVLLRSVDIRGLLDFLRDVIEDVRSKNRFASGSELSAIILKEWRMCLQRGRGIDYRDSFFEASYRGRRRVQNVLRLVNGLATMEQMPEAERTNYQQMVRAKSGSRAQG